MLGTPRVGTVNSVYSSSSHNPVHRCGQPGQQHGRRFPSRSSARARATWFLLVSGLFTEVTQQIHSFRASGVRSFHASRTAEERRAVRRSAGTSCTAPVASFAVMGMDRKHDG